MLNRLFLYAVLAALCLLAAPLRPAHSQVANPHPLWTARFDGVGHGDDYAQKVVADPAGNVYVTGIVSNDKSKPHSNKDYETIKYSPAGVKLWARRFNAISNQNDYLRDLAVDKNGNVYVTGTSYSNVTFNDIKTIKYDTNGNQAWSARFDSGEGDYAVALAIDKTGGVVVAGSSDIANTKNAYKHRTFTLINYDGVSGTMLWKTQNDFSGSDTSLTDQSSSPSVMLRGEDGSLYMAGIVYNRTGIAKYSAQGALLWTTRLEDVDLYPEAIAVDASGVRISGDSYDYNEVQTVLCNPSGALQWFHRYSADTIYQNGTRSYCNASVLDEDGNLYVIGSTELNASDSGRGDDDMLVLKYAPDGTEIWRHFYNASDTGRPDDYAYAIILDSKNHFILSGTSRNPHVQGDLIITLTCDTNGKVLTTRRYHIPSYGYVAGLTLSNNDDIIVAGTLTDTSTGLGDFLTLKYAP